MAEVFLSQVKTVVAIFSPQNQDVPMMSLYGSVCDTCPQPSKKGSHGRGQTFSPESTFLQTLDLRGRGPREHQ